MVRHVTSKLVQVNKTGKNKREQEGFLQEVTSDVDFLQEVTSDVDFLQEVTSDIDFCVQTAGKQQLPPSCSRPACLQSSMGTGEMRRQDGAPLVNQG